MMRWILNGVLMLVLTACGNTAGGGGTDGNVFRQNGIAAAVVGMADHNMHTVREYVTIPDLVDAAHLCETLLRMQ